MFDYDLPHYCLHTRINHKKHWIIAGKLALAGIELTTAIKTLALYPAAENFSLLEQYATQIIIVPYYAVLMELQTFVTGDLLILNHTSID